LFDLTVFIFSHKSDPEQVNEVELAKTPMSMKHYLAERKQLQVLPQPTLLVWMNSAPSEAKPKLTNKMTQ